MGLEEEIQVLSDFLFTHEDIPQQYQIYCQMRNQMYKDYKINENVLLGKVIDHRANVLKHRRVM